MMMSEFSYRIICCKAEYETSESDALNSILAKLFNTAFKCYIFYTFQVMNVSS